MLPTVQIWSNWEGNFKYQIKDLFIYQEESSKFKVLKNPIDNTALWYLFLQVTNKLCKKTRDINKEFLIEILKIRVDK